MTTNAPAIGPKVGIVSLGCPKNLVDSEKMLGLLAQDGVVPVSADASGGDGVADAVQLEGKSSAAMKFKGGTTLDLEASASLGIKGAIVKIEGSGPVQIKGAIVQLG